QAKQAETRIRNDIFDRKFGDGTSRQTLGQFVNTVYRPWARVNKRSWRIDESRLKPILSSFGNKRLSEINPFLVEKFKSERRAAKLKSGANRSVGATNRELRLLSRIFRLAIQNGEIKVNPCREVKVLSGEQARTRYLRPDEELRLMAALTGRRQHIGPIVLLALHTGMRKGELLRLRRDQVDFHRNEIKVTHTKSGHDRFVPMNNTVRQELIRLSRISGGDDLFLNPKTGLTMRDLKTAFNNACREAGIADFRFHDLRHTFGTRAADAGIPLTAIAAIMGHSTITTTMRYAHATDEAKRRAVEAVDWAPESVVKIWPRVAGGRP
ncbi:MAG: tyrosine-type recombinase/integrase, partial [Blastocatellia bacterium]